MAAPRTAPLRNLTREKLEPVWNRLDIPTERIAAALGVTRQGLSFKAKALGLPPRTKNREPQKKLKDDLFRRMWLAGVCTTEMARHFGYSSRSAISHRRVMLGLPPRTRRKGSGKHGGWVQTITIAQFFEMEMARIMGVPVDEEAEWPDAETADAA